MNSAKSYKSQIQKVSEKILSFSFLPLSFPISSLPLFFFLFLLDSSCCLLLISLTISSLCVSICPFSGCISQSNAAHVLTPHIYSLCSKKNESNTEYDIVQYNKSVKRYIYIHSTKMYHILYQVDFFMGWTEYVHQPSLGQYHPATHFQSSARAAPS